MIKRHLRTHKVPMITQRFILLLSLTVIIGLFIAGARNAEMQRKATYAHMSALK